MVASAVIAGVGAAAKLATLPGSFKEQRKMQNSLDGLRSKPMARYSVDPKISEMYKQAYGEASNPEGFGGANVSAFRNTLGRTMRGRYSNALSLSGGQGSRAINSVLNNQGMDSMSNFYVADENMRRSNRQGALNRAGTYASQFQRSLDQNTSNDINYRMQLERGLGEGIRSQRDYRRNMISGMGSDLLTAGMMGAFGGKKVIEEQDGPFNGGVGGPGVTPGLLTQNSRYYLNRNPFREPMLDGGQTSPSSPTNDMPYDFGGDNNFRFGESNNFRYRR